MAPSSNPMPSSEDRGDGLTPQVSQRIADAQSLFRARPSLEIFSRSWSPTAIFEDPICYAQGWKQYAAQWWAMRFFTSSTTSSWRLLHSSSKEISYVQKQIYTLGSFRKEMISTVVMRLDAEGKVEYFADKWDHKDMPGSWAYPLRRLNAYLMPWIVKVPTSQFPSSGTAQTQAQTASKDRDEL